MRNPYSACRFPVCGGPSGFFSSERDVVRRVIYFMILRPPLCRMGTYRPSEAVALLCFQKGKLGRRKVLGVPRTVAIDNCK